MGVAFPGQIIFDASAPPILSILILDLWKYIEKVPMENNEIIFFYWILKNV